MKHKGLLAVLLSVTCGVLITILFKLEVLESLELKSLDFRFRQFAQPESASHEVVIVAIDEKSLQEFKRNKIVWKWPRDIYAALVRYLHRGGAKVIVFDILFADEDIDRLSSDAEETDGAFARAMKEAGKILLGAQFMHEEDLLRVNNPLERKGFLTIDPNNLYETFSSAVLPIPLFQNSASALGATNYKEDPEDGVCRRLPLFYLYQDVIFPHLGLAAYLLANEIDHIGIVSENRIRVGDIVVPLDKKGQFLISWYGKGGPKGCFRYYPFVSLIKSAIAEENNRSPIVPSSDFKDKIIIIGTNATGLFDFRNTPFTVYEPYPAMEIYATLLSNLIQRDFLIRAHPFYAIIAIFFFAFFLCYTFIYVSKIHTVILLTFLSAVGWFIITLAIFKWYNIWVEIVAPEISMMVSFSVAAVVSYLTEGKARRHLRSVFNRYLSPVVISEIMDKSDKIELGGKEITGTVYFSDLQDFTSISEQMSPHDLVSLLNEYFSIATDVILKNEGLIDKYIGDAIMAIFGAPLPNNTHTLQACIAALEVQSLLKQDWQPEKNNRPRVQTRIGINSGPMVVGNIGSNLRLDYTAIGDTVNLASRLEGVNKVFGTNILISEFTFKEVKDLILARELDILRVKGRQEPVAVYELIEKQENSSKEQIELIERFHEGLRWYRERRFDKALGVLQSTLTSFPNDGPTTVYIARCQKFLDSPPSPEWDGVYKLETK